MPTHRQRELRQSPVGDLDRNTNKSWTEETLRVFLWQLKHDERKKKFAQSVSDNSGQSLLRITYPSIQYFIQQKAVRDFTNFVFINSLPRILLNPIRAIENSA